MRMKANTRRGLLALAVLVSLLAVYGCGGDIPAPKARPEANPLPTPASVPVEAAQPTPTPVTTAAQTRYLIETPRL